MLRAKGERCCPYPQEAKAGLDYGTDLHCSTTLDPVCWANLGKAMPMTAGEKVQGWPQTVQELLRTIEVSPLEQTKWMSSSLPGPRRPEVKGRARVLPGPVDRGEWQHLTFLAATKGKRLEIQKPDQEGTHESWQVMRNLLGAGKDAKL